MTISRRGFFGQIAAAAGAYGISKLAGGPLVKSAHADTADAAGGTPALFILNLIGGYNALFGSADSLKGKFGVTANNIQQVGASDLFVDKTTLGALPDALPSMASIGVNHGISAHTTARLALLHQGNASRLIKMAGLLGGTGAVRCAVMGRELPEGDHDPMNGVSLQQVRDLSTTITALGLGTDPNAPDRAVAAQAVGAATAMSAGTFAANARSSVSMQSGMAAAKAQLEQANATFTYADIASRYGITAAAPSTTVDDMRMQILGAELMIRAGANVVIANDVGWDSHDDTDGSEVRSKFKSRALNALRAFTTQTLTKMPNRNVVTVILGDFARSLPNSDHQANLTVTVIGKNVKQGTTGRTNANVGLPNAPGIDGLWAYLAAVLGVAGTPFGANPHALVKP
jgi:hypothetical protein